MSVSIIALPVLSLHIRQRIDLYYNSCYTVHAHRYRVIVCVTDSKQRHRVGKHEISDVLPANVARILTFSVVLT